MKALTLLLLVLCLPISASAQDSSIDVGARIQMRDTIDIDENFVENTLTLRRARLSLEGHVLGEHNQYHIQLGFSPRDLGIVDGHPTMSPLLDYYLDFTEQRDLSVRVGQYKVPFTRERIMSTGDLAFVDRSLQASLLDVGRDFGVTAHSQDFLGLGFLRYFLGLYTGYGRDFFLADRTITPLFASRVEYHPLGLYNNYDQVDFGYSETLRTSFGLGYAFTDYVHRVTVDGHLAIRGFSVEAAALMRATQDVVDVGYYIQIGTLVPETEFLGIAARYGAAQEQNELGLSLSYYFERHNMKLQLDGFQIWARDGSIDAQRIRLHLQVAL